jgi:hypothetical protein
MTAVTSSLDRSVVPQAGGVHLAVREVRHIVDDDAPSRMMLPAGDAHGSSKAEVDLEASNDSSSENDSAMISFNERSFVLPRCAVPCSEELQPVEDFVEAAILEQDGLAETASPVKNYKVILDCIRLKRDTDMLWKLLIALRTSGHGSTMHRLTSSNKKHARLIHPVLRLNPFELPAKCASTTTTISTPNSSPPSLGPDYDLADAQLHFLAAVVSSNAVFLVPTLTFAWKLLTSQRENVSHER